jgi:tubulin polyglutamylase TTLL6/13
VFTGKKLKLTAEERDILRNEAQKMRDIYENEHLGGFEKIYPTTDEAQMKQYQIFLEHSDKLY